MITAREIAGGIAQILECKLMWVAIHIIMTRHKHPQYIDLRAADSDDK
jgi:hypothetical protein